MDHVAELAVQLQELQQSKQELDVRIKKLEQQLLSTEELAQQKLLLSNQGGQKSHRGITTEIKRNHVWDQEVLTEMNLSPWPIQRMPWCRDYMPRTPSSLVLSRSKRSTLTN